MKIKSKFLVAKTELKEGKNGAYIIINLLDMSSGDMFEVVHKNIEDFGKFELMQQQEIELKLSSSKYGLKLDIINIL